MTNAPETLPVTVIGGYLGAGKTTLVNHLLRHAGGRRLAVLVNEFGDLPIDADLIEARDDGLISIAGGCICCSFGSDLAAALVDLAAFEPRPDHILIEASGVALPGAIASTVSLLGAYAIDATVVVADAVTVKARASDAYVGDTIARQLTDADIVVLNKTTDLSASAVGDLNDWLSAKSGGAPVLATPDGAVPVAAVFGLRAGVTAGGTIQGHADGLFETLVLRPECSVDVRALARDLAASDLGVVRCKGFLHDARGGVALIQTVGTRHDVVPADANSRVGLICIGLKRQLDRPGLRRLVEKSAALAPAPRPSIR